MGGVAANLVSDYLVNRRRVYVLVMARKEATCGVGVGRESEVAHIVEYEQVIPVLGERGHEWRHAKIEFRASIYIPGWRVDPVGLEKGHEPERGGICGAPRRTLPDQGCRLHEIQERQRKQGPSCAAKKGAAIYSPVPIHGIGVNCQFREAVFLGRGG